MGRPPTQRRAIGIARVSVEGGREHIYSYDIQAAALRQDCETGNRALLYIARERNVSGGANLANRPELARAVEAVEAGEADLIIVAYFDRFFRSLATQSEVIERIERAGGELLTLDHGRLTNGTAATRLQANVVGAMSQFFREQTAEKSAAGQAEAVARGAMPWARVPLGYHRAVGEPLEPNPDEVPLVQRCFEMRIEGASYMTIRAWLRDQGIQRSPRGVDVMLHNRAYLGEIHFGKIVNPRAHKAIIDRDVFNRVGRMRIARGPQPGSDRLLARLRVLRCGSCGSPLGSMKLPRQGDYPIYRCPSSSDCPRHVTISAEIAEAFVWEAVKIRHADERGRASAAHSATRAVADRDAAQATLERALRAYGEAGLAEEPAAVDTLSDLRSERDRRQARVDDLPPDRSLEVEPDDRLPLSTKRSLIKSLIRRVDVAPSGPQLPKGAARLSVEFVE